MEVAADYAPDVVLGLKMAQITPDTLRLLRQRGALVALWYVDCFDEQVPETIGALFREVDVFMTSAAGMLPRYRALGPTPSYWVYEGVYLPAFPAVAPSAAQWATYASDVAFIGNVFHPPVPDAELALRRYALLCKIAGRHTLKVWGPQGDPQTQVKWECPAPLIRWPAFHEETVKICQAARIVLGINTVNTVERYFSNRTYLTLASGGFHLTHYVPGLETMFQNHRHLVWYRDDAECLDLLDYYLPREDTRREIARAGRQWTRRRYSMRRQVGKILAILGAHLAEQPVTVAAAAS
jgi:spore maturation protein CgeB